MTSVPHVVFWAAVVLVAVALAAAAIGFSGDRRRAAIIGVPLALLFITAAFDSPMRRVGDGTEYLVMARNMAMGRVPAVIQGNVNSLLKEVSRHGDTSWVLGLDPTLLGRDQRFGMTHFWLFPLFAVPGVAVARGLHLHPAAGFTALNITCLILLIVAVARRAGSEVAVLVACALLWWTDKVHAEVFLATTAIVGLLWLEDHPVRALMLLGVATAQMPLFGVVLGVAGLATILRRASDRRIWIGGAAAIAIAGLHPAYYLWHLGRLSPLRDVLSLNVPGIHLLMTPLFDPNVGMAWYAPALTCLAIAGLVVACRARPPAFLIAAAAGLVTIMVAAAQMPNVNHGGTPGPSRHGLWCVVLLTPFAVYAAERLTRRTRLVVAVAALFTLVFSAAVLHPRNEEGYSSATPLAMWTWTHAPWLDNPVPEIFAERIGGGDGAPVPAATPACEKVLLVGDGQHVRWPVWCQPSPVPSECAQPGAYCYWNNGRVARPPRFSRFDASLATEWRTFAR